MSASLSDEALDQLFRNARSYNGYLDRPVTEAQMCQVWDLMKFGPTSANLMPARIVWCKSDRAREQLAITASGTNAVKIRNAPVTAIIAMDMEFYNEGPRLFPHADVRPWFAGDDVSINETAMRNSSLQGAYFILSARALGLDTGPMSGFNNAAVDELFFSGTSYKSNFISTLGYGDRSTILERLPRPEFAEFNSIA